MVNIADLTSTFDQRRAGARTRITGSDGGNDTIDGAGDEDTANGRAGDDFLFDSIADAAPNHLFAGAGDDVLRGGTGA